MIEEMCKHVEKPLVFPLSNPTSQAEITAENAYKYSKGKCIFAAGKTFFPHLPPCCMHSHIWQLLSNCTAVCVVNTVVAVAIAAVAAVA